MKKILVLLAIFFSACSHFDFKNNGNGTYFNSNIFLSENIKSDVILEDILNYVKQYQDKSSIFYLYTNDKNTIFFNKLLDILRKEGYAISEDAKASKLDFLGYTIYQYENNVFVNLNVNAYKINIVYDIQGDVLKRKSVTVFTY